MPLDVEKLGTAYPEKVSVLDPDRAKQYAAATNDPNPAYAEGRAVPPVFAVVPAFDAVGEVGA